MLRCSHRLAWSILALAAILGPAAAAESGGEGAIRISAFSLHREKIGAVAVVEATLANGAAVSEGPFDAVLQVLDSYALVKESDPLAVAAIPPGKDVKIRFEIKHCPAFSWLRIVLRPKGQSAVAHCFVSRSLDRPPTADTAGATVVRRVFGADAKLTILEARAGAADGGTTELSFKVRNASPEAVHFPLARLRFLDAAGREVASRPCLLGLEEIPPAAEDEYRASVGGLPAYAKMQVDAAWGESILEQPEGLGDASVKDLTVEGYRFVRFTHGDLWVLGRLVSRLRDPAADVVLSLQLTDKAGKEVRRLRYAFPGPVGPGERQGFEIWAAAAPAYEGYKFSLAFNIATNDGGAPKPPPRNEDPGLVVAERTARRTAASPPSEKADAKKDLAVAQVELTGWSWVEGSQVRVNITRTTYTGDAGFLKMRFLGPNGLPVKPDGTVILRVYNRGQPQGTIRRALHARAWQKDAAKLDVTDADEVAASGPEAWVGVLRVPDRGAVDLTVDVTVDIPKAGTWEWKKVAAPYTTGPTPPTRTK